MIRLPKSLSSASNMGSKQPTGAEVLEAEMMVEQAYALGLVGKRLQKALEDYAKSNGDPRRTQIAANAAHDFFIQREMIGFTNHDYVIEFYKIPPAVLARVGASGETD